VHPFVTLVTADLVAQAHAAGLAVNVWTVNAPADLAAMVALGVDAVITDRLGDALAVARPDPAV
jgi:glycerophosphoryl diester phosphodiesterase